jgi:hypothetical protein
MNGAEFGGPFEKNLACALDSGVDWIVKAWNIFD